MPKPYSLDIRKKAIEHYKEGNHKLKEISSFLKISPKTLYVWIQKYKKGQSLEAKIGYQKGHSHTIKDLQEFRKIVENNNISTRQEILDIVKVGSVWSIGRALKKIAFVKKKPKKDIESKMM